MVLNQPQLILAKQDELDGHFAHSVSFDIEIKDAEFKNGLINLVAPLYNYVPLEFEYEEIRYKKPTGNTIWNCGSPRTLANNLLLTFPTIKYIESYEMFVINQDGFLRTITFGCLKQYILKQTPNSTDLSPKFIHDSIDLLKNICNCTVYPEHNVGAAPFKNVILNRDPEKSYAFIQWHNIKYIPNVLECPPIFLNYITLLTGDEKTRDIVFAYMCYLLHESKIIQQNLWLVGDPHDGKSQLLEFIGQTIISAKNMDFDQLLEDRAMQASLRNMFVLIFDEVQYLKMDYKFVETIKRWAVMQTMKTRGFKQESTDESFYARTILASNVLPNNTFLDKAFYERHIIVQTHKSYTGTMIGDFAKELLKVKNEVWSWIYDNYHTKMEMILGIRSKLTAEDYSKHIDPFNKFISCCEIADDYITAEQLYTVYKLNNPTKTLGSSEFFRRINKQPIEKDRIRLQNGTRPTVYFVKFNSSIDSSSIIKPVAQIQNEATHTQTTLDTSDIFNVKN